MVRDWLDAGEIADDGTLVGMRFYVEGISGDIPKGGVLFGCFALPFRG